MVRLYTKGRTTREIAAEIGIDAKTVRRILADAAIERRRTGPRGRLDVDTEAILEMRDDLHMSWQEIADAAGMSKTGVRMRYATATTGRIRVSG